MEGRKLKPSPAIAPGACIALVETALQKARLEHKDSGSGLTLDLSDQKIASIPNEVAIMVKDEVERLALGHNQLASFDSEFALCSRLRYLNVRSNFFRDFPTVLCSMASLEILDISRNKIRELPQDFGHLIKLKVLSISKNRIRILPSYIAQMDELKILKIDHNPISDLPPDIFELDEESETDKDVWLERLKSHLKQNMEKKSSSHETTSSNSSDEENDTDYSNVSKFPLKGNSIEKSLIQGVGEEPTQGQTSATDDPVIDDPGVVPAIPSKNLQRKFAAPAPAKALSKAAVKVATIPQTSERSRSNSESGAVNRAAKRMGYIGQKNTLGTVDEVRTIKHHVRGISYDSSINEAAQRASNVPNGGEIASSLSNNANVGEDIHQAEPYFRKLQEASRLSLGPEGSMGATLVETARCILYSIYKVQPAIDSYVGLIKERNQLPTTGIDRVLPAANLNISSLVQSLEGFEAKDSPNSLDVLLNTSHTAILTFKHVLNQLQLVVQGAANNIDSRYTRTVLLAIFGALVELQQAWSRLRKYIPPLNSNRTGNPLVSNRAKPPLSSILNLTGLTSNSAPRTQEGGFIPATPSTVIDNPLENPDEMLFNKLGQSVAATQYLISQLAGSIKKTASQQNPHVQQSTLQKLRELDKTCNSGSDVAKRLEERRSLISEADWVEKRKFYDDITRFVNAVMSIGEMLKAGSSEFGFPKQVLGHFSPVARLTKEVTVLLHSSSFRALNEPLHSIAPHSAITTSATSFPGNVHFQPLSPAPFSAVPSTPLSAVLGPAAQATVPFMAPGGPNSSQFVTADQRSNTMQSNLRTMTGISKVGFVPGVLSPRR